MNDTMKRRRQSVNDSRNGCSSEFPKDATPPVRNELPQKQINTDMFFQIASKKARAEPYLEDIGLATPPSRDAVDAISTSKDMLNALYSESVVAKIWGVAKKALDKVSSVTLKPAYVC
jgi:hypothetical protein